MTPGDFFGRHTSPEEARADRELTLEGRVVRMLLAKTKVATLSQVTDRFHGDTGGTKLTVSWFEDNVFRPPIAISARADKFLTKLSYAMLVKAPTKTPHYKLLAEAAAVMGPLDERPPVVVIAWPRLGLQAVHGGDLARCDGWAGMSAGRGKFPLTIEPFQQLLDTVFGKE